MTWLFQICKHGNKRMREPYRHREN